MRALTVRQPYAWAIFHGKDVENRTQAWSYRGPLAIHAGARWSDRGGRDLRVAKACASSWPIPPCGDMLDSTARSIARHGLEPSLYPSSIALAGAIIGVVDLVDVHSADWCWEPEGLCSPWAEASYDEHDGGVRHDVVHLVLANPRPLATPIPAKGRLGLWTPDAALLDRIRDDRTKGGQP